MYGAGKILTGLVIFIVIMTFPLWYNAMTGKASYRPEPQIVSLEKQCVESTPYMKSSHMKLLDLWRQRVVRGGDRVYQTADGRTYTMSLTNTCLECHSDKEKFCDQCHNYVGVTPTCWNCHFSKSSKYSWP